MILTDYTSVCFTQHPPTTHSCCYVPFTTYTPDLSEDNLLHKITSISLAVLFEIAPI